ncbi:asparagine synthase (glutamine-hydrolyzing) [Oceanobacillus senegalensis]|uniref:asparagine synthase (glutamine-hydrolyzing) n=1 Tax=Oceanobacillus senegalensis TaxID=1936063 RepID=UPI000A30B214|nr:asparagine synthase (glutamine-hydrolyzing) [Oceanobacillus senegalensis]
MCGFVSVMRHPKVSKVKQHSHSDITWRSAMIRHRGPDDEDIYHDNLMSLAFRRLRIIDLKRGRQPLPFADSRYWLVFNGEIYNYKEWREKLASKGYTFETDSDTEVIGKLFLEEGVQAFSKLRGMFAILIWDRKEKTVYGARDPFGIKPFYYQEKETETLFASEEKSLVYNTNPVQLDNEALQHYFSFQYVPEPRTLFEDIKKVEPGSYFIKKAGEPIQFTRYFHATFQPVDTSKNEVIHTLRKTLDDSVQAHMQSDVPVGAFLSGGIDSSFIVALAKQYHPNIETFSVGFDCKGFSELDVAKETADKLGVRNHSYHISAKEFIDALPDIVWHLDDPLADPACVPLYFVARYAKKHVKVVLSGEGADELFGGYNIYHEPHSLQIFDKLPTSFTKAIHRLADIFPEGMKGKSFLKRGTTPLSDRYIGNAKIFEEKQKETFYKAFDYRCTYHKITAPLYHLVKNQDKIHQMQYIDIHTWLPGDILLKADRMTMAHSLELRVPFLDKEVYNIARRIPTNQTVTDGTTKWVVRKAAQGIVPDHVLNQRKLGFPVPIRHWLKDELYDWAKELIQQSETNHLIDKSVALQLLDYHASGKRDYSRHIWTIIIFMMWHQIFIEQRHPYFIKTMDSKREYSM